MVPFFFSYLFIEEKEYFVDIERTHTQSRVRGVYFQKRYYIVRSRQSCILSQHHRQPAAERRLLHKCTQMNARFRTIQIYTESFIYTQKGNECTAHCVSRCILCCAAAVLMMMGRAAAIHARRPFMDCSAQEDKVVRRLQLSNRNKCAHNGKVAQFKDGSRAWSQIFAKEIAFRLMFIGGDGGAVSFVSLPVRECANKNVNFTKLMQLGQRFQIRFFVGAARTIKINKELC